MVSPEFRILLDLPLGEVNRMLEIISEKPYKEIAGLLHDVRNQAELQVSAATAPAQPPLLAPADPA